MIEYTPSDVTWFNDQVPGPRRRLADEMESAYERDMQASAATAAYWQREAHAERVKRQSVERGADEFIRKVKLFGWILGAMFVLVSGLVLLAWRAR